MKTKISVLLLLGCLLSIKATTTNDITAFGAIGDCVTNSYMTITAGSVQVVFTNTVAIPSIGQTIEIFRGGTQTSGNGINGTPVVDNQDLIATITNVIGTTAYINVPCQTNKLAYVTYGTDNSLAISNAIAQASLDCYIYAPNGNYLIMPIRNSPAYSYVSVLLTRGGLHFLGQSQSGTIFTGRGAWQYVVAFSYTYRGFLFEIMAPTTNSALPVVFDNMTLDGGLQQALRTSNPGVNINQVDGLGWDTQHSALLTYDQLNKGLTVNNVIFTNVTVQHFAGEMLKSIDANTNMNVSMYNTTFYDGQASALNIHGGGIRTNCFFNQLFLVSEEAMAYYTNTTTMIGCTLTNIASNMFSWDVDLITQPPFFFTNNTCSLTNGNAFNIASGVNIYIQNNRIYATNGATIFTVTGSGGVGNTINNSNIWITGNTISANSLQRGVSFGGSSATFSGVTGLVFANNTFNVPIIQVGVGQYAGVASNITLSNNTFNTTLMGMDMHAGTPIAVFQTNNAYNPYGMCGGGAGTTNLFSYGGDHQEGGVSYGGWRCLTYKPASCGNNANSVFRLNDSTESIQTGTQLIVDNIGNASTIYIIPSSTGVPAYIPIVNSSLLFTFNGTTWVTNSIPSYTLTVNNGTGSGTYASNSIVPITGVGVGTFNGWNPNVNIANTNLQSTTYTLTNNGSATANFLAPVTTTNYMFIR